MEESIEYKTVDNCTISLEKALKSLENKIVFFLKKKDFITDDVYSNVLNPNSSLTAANKTFQLIEGIKNRIDQDKNSYQVLIDGFTQGGSGYGPIVEILKKEYAKQANSNMQSDESANSSTSENGDQEEACPRSTRKFGELSHDKASSKSSKNLRKRARSKSMEDETGSDLKARSHKQSKVRASSPHEEAKRGKSKRKHKQKSADRCGSGKSPAGPRHHLASPPKSHHSRRSRSSSMSPSPKSHHSRRRRLSPPPKSHHSRRRRSSSMSPPPKIHRSRRRRSSSMSPPPKSHYSCRSRSSSLSPPPKIHRSRRSRSSSMSPPPKSHYSRRSRSSSLSQAPKSHRSRRRRSSSNSLSPPSKGRHLSQSSMDRALQVDSEDPEDSMEDSFRFSCFNLCWKEDGSEEKILPAGQSLFVAGESYYWGEKILKVHFMNYFPGQHDYGGKPLTKDMIIGWMNEWRGRGGKESSVPMFVPADEHEGNADIRIEFRFDRESRTCLGIKAKKRKKDEATMYLKLQDGPKAAKNPYCYKKYTVLHETGHALGFYHEHQHPDFDADIFNKDIVMKDTGCDDEFYKENFGKIAQVKSNNGFRYNKHSVMMYRVKKSWIRKKFHNKILSGKRKLKYGSPLDEFFWPESALTGKLTIEDKEEAQKEYEKIFPDGAGVEQPDESCMETDTGAGLGGLPRRMETDSAMKLDVEDVEDVVEEVAPLAAVWDRLALKLHLKYDSIDIINRDNPRDSRACLTKAIAEWTKRSYNTEKFGVPSWKMLIIAVQSIDKALAQKIAAKHNVSMP